MKSKACFFAKKSPEALQRDSKEKIGAALNFGDLSNAALEQLQIYVNDVCNINEFSFLQLRGFYLGHSTFINNTTKS